MTLWDAPFRRNLRILSLSGFGTADEETRMVLTQLGIDQGETIQKIHDAPLRDPVSLMIGEQVFTLRKEICRKIEVEATP